MPATVLDQVRVIQVIESGSQCTVRLNDYKTPEEAAKLMFEDLKDKLKPRLSLAAMERKQRYGSMWRARIVPPDLCSRLRHGDSEGGQHEVGLTSVPRRLALLNRGCCRSLPACAATASLAAMPT